MKLSSISKYCQMWSTKIRKKEHEDSQSPFLRYYDILNRKRQRDRLCVLFLSFLSINFLYGWRSLSSMSLDAIYDSKVTLFTLLISRRGSRWLETDRWISQRFCVLTNSKWENFARVCRPRDDDVSPVTSPERSLLMIIIW